MGSTMRGTPHWIGSSAAPAVGSDRPGPPPTAASAVNANNPMTSPSLRINPPAMSPSGAGDYLWLPVVVVEAFARLAAQQLGRNHAPQQRDGRVIGVAVLVVQG